uniref:Uncharacterized protein n=1 Tax=Chromera velia CCMP2878 TaxID=1169474 RepID=A0A0G4HRK2_9ALVE|eukprot:Cvel_30629.t1-p1 / transcript=Cvel_30629.t1 / gene=Cvel_30629 / organism=Chromera_velia_CCMP2878 / gene_product=Putative ankyrin repeat protein RF_0381, putative / transcript_product=Putative ankyrin repeat protein RF_0381, putative / location=Cvel_scaffold4402:6648-8180(+) / protein_length=511 / sequence_SO=supercontig / SO=protein_coding / is_pseudo=false
MSRIAFLAAPLFRFGAALGPFGSYVGVSLVFSCSASFLYFFWQARMGRRKPTETATKAPSSHLPLPRSCVEEELNRVEGVVLGVVEEIRKQKQLLAAVKAQANAQTEKKKVPPQSSSLFQVAGTDPLSDWREITEAQRLYVQVGGMAAKMKKKIAVAFQEIIGYNFSLSLYSLLKAGVGPGSVIRSFGAVTPETLKSALEAFLERGEVEDLRLCLTVGADVDGLVNGQTALMRAARAGNMRAVIRLVRAGAGLEVKRAHGGTDCGGTALHIACRRRQGQIARYLLSEGANANAETDHGLRPLHIAAWTGFSDLFVPLLTQGADIHAKHACGSTALHFAAGANHREAAAMLVDFGALVSEGGDNGMSPLHYTVATVADELTDHTDVAELLISRGANVNARKSEGGTVLHSASYWGSADVAEQLLDAGADIHLTDDDDWMALHYTAMRTHEMNQRGVDHQKKLRIAQMLVARGINVHALTYSGLTALAIAERDLPADSPIRTFLASLPLQQEE